MCNYTDATDRPLSIFIEMDRLGLKTFETFKIIENKLWKYNWKRLMKITSLL